MVTRYEKFRVESLYPDTEVLNIRAMVGVTMRTMSQ